MLLLLVARLLRASLLCTDGPLRSFTHQCYLLRVRRSCSRSCCLTFCCSRSLRLQKHVERHFCCLNHGNDGDMKRRKLFGTQKQNKKVPAAGPSGSKSSTTSCFSLQYSSCRASCTSCFCRLSLLLLLLLREGNTPSPRCWQSLSSWYRSSSSHSCKQTR